jgi:predicted nucleotide-binding protein (sugar kinase/HSP70/actin superfamily)
MGDDPFLPSRVSKRGVIQTIQTDEEIAPSSVDVDYDGADARRHVQVDNLALTVSAAIRDRGT